MILRAEFKGPIRRDKLELLYLPFAHSRFHRTILVDGNPATLVFLRGTLVVSEGTRLENEPVFAHCGKEIASFEEITLELRGK